MRTKLMLAALAALPVVAPAASAHAVSAVRYCAVPGTVTFSPPLTAVDRQGSGNTMTWSYTSQCAIAHADGTTGTQSVTGVYVFAWTGSCVTARFTGPSDSGTMAGGVQMVTTSTGGATRVRHWTLIPQGGNPCNMTTATVVQQAVDVFP